MSLSFYLIAGGKSEFEESVGPDSRWLGRGYEFEGPFSLPLNLAAQFFARLLVRYRFHAVLGEGRHPDALKKSYRMTGCCLV